MTPHLTGLTRSLRAHLQRIQHPQELSPPESAAPDRWASVLVAVRLLVAHAGRAAPAAITEFLSAMEDLLVWLSQHPGSCEVRYRVILPAFSDVLEQLLASLDAGVDLATVITESRVGQLDQALAAVWSQTGLSPAAFLAQTRQLWSQMASPGPQDTCRTSERLILREQWRILRDECNAFFGLCRSDSQMCLADRRVILLTDNAFRATELRGKLIAGGFRALLCFEPEEVIAQLQSAGRFWAVLTDDLEPSRNLKRLSANLGGLQGLPCPPLVLLTGARGSGLRDRAERLGACGVWRPPFRLTDFLALLAESPEDQGA